MFVSRFHSFCSEKLRMPLNVQILTSLWLFLTPHPANILLQSFHGKYKRKSQVSPKDNGFSEDTTGVLFVLSFSRNFSALFFLLFAMK